MEQRSGRVTPTGYVSVDVEADGPIPGPFSMVSFGAVVAGWHDGAGFRRAEPGAAAAFHRELRPIAEEYDPRAPAVSGPARAALEAGGAAPRSRCGSSGSGWSSCGPAPKGCGTGR
ncbi:hypothetical protein ABT247_24835 [Kitasatospora sp. NPDC001539]|uniref:hypothetical protein n=1 Tax=Kitasatospora sp. NPDC001539 TaxID=3154384 RepID=UPI00331C32A2